jgi:hypothetical protein
MEDDLASDKDVQRLPFPVKLYEMLEDAEEQGFSHIISWKSDNSFMVYDSDAFVKQVAPGYFAITKYK